MSAAERHNGQITSKLRSLEASDSRNRGLLKKLRKRKAEMQVFVRMPSGQKMAGETSSKSIHAVDAHFIIFFAKFEFEASPWVL